MALINDIATAKRYVKVMFNNSTSSLADISAAETRFLVPILGQTLYDLLLSEQNEAESPYATLIEYARRAAGPLAYWQDLPTIQTEITDRGVGTFASTNMQSAHRWEYKELRESLADKGAIALEQMLQHLNENATTYSWTIPEDYKLIFLTGKDFFKYFPIAQPYRTYESLRPVVRQAEDQYIRAAIGDDFFEELRDNATPSAEEIKAIALIKKSLANLSIKLAIEVLPVKISAHGFTVAIADLTDNPTMGEGQPADSQLGMMYKSVERTGETYLLQLKDYLNANASETVFATYFASEFYEAADTTDIIDRNENRTGVFGF